MRKQDAKIDMSGAVDSVHHKWLVFETVKLDHRPVAALQTLSERAVAQYARAKLCMLDDPGSCPSVTQTTSEETVSCLSALPRWPSEGAVSKASEAASLAALRFPGGLGKLARELFPRPQKPSQERKTSLLGDGITAVLSSSRELYRSPAPLQEPVLSWPAKEEAFKMQQVSL